MVHVSDAEELQSKAATEDEEGNCCETGLGANAASAQMRHRYKRDVGAKKASAQTHRQRKLSFGTNPTLAKTPRLQKRSVGVTNHACIETRVAGWALLQTKHLSKCGDVVTNHSCYVKYVIV